MPEPIYITEQATRIVVVWGSGSAERMKVYLYAHTQPILVIQGSHKFVAVCVTEAQDAEQAAYLADYQAGRLGSGLYGAKVFSRAREAYADEDVRYALKLTDTPLAKRILALGPDRIAKL